MHVGTSVSLLVLLVEIVIGFVEPSYDIVESGEEAQICADIKSGTLRTTVAAQFSTANGAATGRFSK